MSRLACCRISSALGFGAAAVEAEAGHDVRQEPGQRAGAELRVGKRRVRVLAVADRHHATLDPIGDEVHGDVREGDRVVAHEIPRPGRVHDAVDDGPRTELRGQGEPAPHVALAATEDGRVHPAANASSRLSPAMSSVGFHFNANGDGLHFYCCNLWHNGGKIQADHEY